MPNPDQPSPQEQLAAEYELPESDAPVEEAEPQQQERARGPDGKFLPAEPPKPQHSAFQVRLALDAGMDQSEIDGYTPDQLEAVLRREWKNKSARREEVTNRDLPQAREVPARDVPAELDDNAPAPKKAAFEHGLTDENSTPELRAAIEKLRDHYEAELAAVREEVGGVKQHVQTQANLSTQQRIDRWFADKADRYGKGTRSELEEGSPELVKRMALIRTAESLAKKGEPIAATLARADKILYGESAPAQPAAATHTTPAAPVTQPAQPTSRQQVWNEGGTAFPTQQVPGEEPPGRARAIRNLRDRQRSLVSNGSEHAELPD